MIQKDQYIFYLKVGSDGSEVRVTPIWTNSHQRTTAKEADRVFFRFNISQQFRFGRGNGYEIINNSPISATFFLRIMEVVNGQEQLYYSGEFNKSDCNFDDDIGNVLALVRPSDRYTNFLANNKKQYNLTGLGVEPEEVRYDFFPMLQVYVAGAKTVFNLQPGGVYERPVEPVLTTLPLTQDLFFSESFDVGIIPAVDGLPIDVSGLYLRGGIGPNGSREWVSLDSQYGVSYTLVALPGTNVTNGTKLELRNRISNTVIYESEDIVPDPVLDFSLDFGSNTGPVMTSVTDNTAKVRFYRMSFLARVLLVNGMDIDGINGQPIPTGDQYAQGTNYTLAAPWDFTGSPILPSVSFSETDQGFGLFPPGEPTNNSGKFILQPGLPNGAREIYPIHQNEWLGASWWFYLSNGDYDKLSEGKISVKLNDAYSLEGVVSKLLDNMAPDDGISFNPDQEHSLLLFGDTNPVTGRPKTNYYVTPKQNVLKFTYDRPATKAPIRYSEILEALKVFFQAEDFIDDDSRLRIECPPFFENGQTYDTGNPIIGQDLTTLIEPATGKPWSYKTNKFGYAKERLPDEITFACMDRQSDSFNGESILVLDEFVNKGVAEDRFASRFSTDIQMAISQPSAFNEDGFFLLACRLDSEGVMRVISYEIPGYEFRQNGELAFPSVNQDYYKYNMPGNNLLVNGQEVQSLSIRPAKRQQIGAPIPRGFSPLTLIKTGIGNGVVDSIAENMSTKFGDIILFHGTN